MCNIYFAVNPIAEIRILISSLLNMKYRYSLFSFFFCVFFFFVQYFLVFPNIFFPGSYLYAIFETLENVIRYTCYFREMLYYFVICNKFYMFNSDIVPSFRAILYFLFYDIFSTTVLSLSCLVFPLLCTCHQNAGFYPWTDMGI